MRLDYFSLSSDVIKYERDDPVEHGKKIHCFTSSSFAISLSPSGVSARCGKSAGSFTVNPADAETPVVVEISADLAYDPRDPENAQRARTAQETLTKHPERVHPALCFLDQQSEWWAPRHYSGETYRYGVNVGGRRLTASAITRESLGTLEAIGEAITKWLADLHRSLNSWTVRRTAPAAEDESAAP